MTIDFRRQGGLGIALLFSSLLGSCGRDPGNGAIWVDLSSADKEYCHEIAFPQGWRYPLKDSRGLDYPIPYKEYEFRAGNAPGEFLVAGAFEQDFSPRYTTNKYRVELSSALPTVVPIDDATWEKAAAKIVPLYRKSILPTATTIPPEDRAEFQNKVFVKTGVFWPGSGEVATRLSPDQTWLVLQSTTRPGRGRVFFDVFSVSTGARLLALQGPLEAVWPDELMNQTGWLTERYFVIPTGGIFERSVICDFDRARGRSSR